MAPAAKKKKAAAAPASAAGPLRDGIDGAFGRRAGRHARLHLAAGSRLADAARDVRASQVDDVLTIVVAEQASAVATGATKTSRASSTKNSISRSGGHHQGHRAAGEPGQHLRRHAN